MRTTKSSFEVIVQVITLLGMAVYLKGMALGAEMMIVDPVNALLWMAIPSRVSLHLPFFRRTVTADTRF